MEKWTRQLLQAFGVGALAYLALMGFLPYPGAFLLKAIPIWMLMILMWTRVEGVTGKMLAVGFGLSSVGDIALTFKAEIAFLIGLGFFLLAHVTYTLAFSRKMKFEVKRLPFMIFVLALAITMGIILAPHLKQMAIPVYAYLVVITTMAIFSALRTDVSPILMLGGLIFMTSDTLLAIALFIGKFPFSAPAIMITYYLAQFGIAWAFIQPRAAQAPTMKQV